MDQKRQAAATLTAAALVLSGIAAAAAQEEAEPMTPPAPGEPFAAILSGSVSFMPLDAPTEECGAPVMTITDAAGSSTLGEITLHA